MAANPVFGHSERKAFVASLQLSEMRPITRLGAAPIPGPAIADGKEGTFVAAGSVVSFVAGVSGQSQNDVLNSALLAQLASDKKFNREKNVTDWYDFYRSVLENVGWVLQGFDFTEYKAGGDKFEADKAILEILAAVVTQNELLIIKAAIEAAKSLPTTDGRISLFDHFTTTGTTSAFQIGVASQQNNAVAMKMGAFLFTAKTNVTQVLWFKFANRDSSLTKSTQTITLNTEVYDQVRTTVQQKLGDLTRTFVANLDI
jgi:hypothetical protein